MPVAGPKPRQTSTSSTHTTEGTARTKVNTADSAPMAMWFFTRLRHMSAPNRMPSRAL